MKYIFLAAGKSVGQFDSDTPVCLAPFNSNKRVLDVLIENVYESGGKDIYVVGGFGILLLLEQYPKLKYFYKSQRQ